MYNYHADIIWKIDILLIALSAIFSLAIIAYVIVQKFMWNWRKKQLLKIKDCAFELLQGGNKQEKAHLEATLSNITPRQFLDVQTNRNRISVFFNENEQRLIGSVFTKKGKISTLEKAAGSLFDKWRRIEAILCLGYIGAPSTVKVIAKCVKSRDDDICYFSILALGQIKTADSVNTLLSIVKNKSAYRYKVASILENFPPETLGGIVDLTAEKKPEIRFWALKLLSRVKGRPHVRQIEKMASDDSAEVRSAACEYLGLSGNKGTKEIIQKCLKDRQWQVRQSAVTAISNLLGDECIPLVINMLNDGSLSVIDAVKKVITRHIDAVMPFIPAFLKGPDEFAKKILAEAIGSAYAALPDPDRAGLIKKIRAADASLADRIEEKPRGGTSR